MRNACILILGMLLLSCNSSSLAQDEIKKKIESVVQQAVEEKIFSGVVLVTKQGKVIYKTAVGYSDLEKNAKNTLETKFEIGSITKFFTKTIILQLAAKGKLKLNDPLGDYFPDFPGEKKLITIEQLMRHRSGLGNYFDLKIWDEVRHRVQSLQEIVEIIKSEPLKFQPGSQAAYSNSGYVLLAAIAQKISGRDFGDLLKQQIFSPANMVNTGFSVINAELPGKAKGYFLSENNKLVSNATLRLTGAGDGGIYSTVEDLWNFTESLFQDGKLLENDWKLRLVNDIMPQHTYDSWMDFKKMGRLTITGGDPGVSALLGMNNQGQYNIIVLSNFSEGSGEKVAMRISQILRGETPEPFASEADNMTPKDALVLQLEKYIKENGKEGFAEYYKEAYRRAGIPLDNDMVLLAVGKKFLANKQISESIALYEVYTKDYPNIIVAWNDLADAYILNGENNKAKKCFEEALRLQPENKRAKEGLSKLR